MSRTIDRLAQDAAAALRAINTARAAARAWRLVGEHAPDPDIGAGNPLIIDVDATLVTDHCSQPTVRSPSGREKHIGAASMPPSTASRARPGT